MDLQDSVQRSLQNPAEKILQICTDSQRSKTWVVNYLIVESLDIQKDKFQRFNYQIINYLAYDFEPKQKKKRFETAKKIQQLSKFFQFIEFEEL